jgi:peptidyl-prolyl cis-trans isomerase SurA
MKIFKILFLVILFQISLVLSGYAEIIDYIVATVDEEIITFSELKEKLAPVIEHYNKIYSGKELEDILKKTKEDTLNELIEEKILLINAEKSNIEVTEEEVDRYIEELKGSFSTPEEFYAEIEKDGITLADLKEKTKSRIKISKFIKLVIFKDVRITEEEIANFYEENKDSFLMPGQVRISHILIKTSGNNDAEKRIEEIFQKLESGGDFSTLAKLYSEGPNASSGGDLGFVYMEELHPQIKEAITKIEVGKYTKPILTPAGYHIIKLEARKLPQYKPISEVKDLIREKLYNLKMGEAYKTWMEKAKKDVEIVIFNRGKFDYTTEI